MHDILSAIVYFVGCVTIAVAGMKAAELAANWVLDKLGNPPESSDETYFRRQVERPYAEETDDELLCDLMQTTDDLNTVIGISVGMCEPSDTLDASLRTIMRRRRRITIEEIIRREARTTR